MKIRNAYVSNSSSSSFILSTSDLENTKIKIEIDLSKINGIQVITSIKQLKKYFESEYGMYTEEDDWAMPKFNACVEELNAGKVIVVGTMSNDSGNSLESFLYEEGLKGYVVGPGANILADLDR